MSDKILSRKITAADVAVMTNLFIDEYSLADKILATKVADLLTDCPNYRDEILDLVAQQIGGDKLESLSHFRKEIAYAVRE